MEHDPNRDMNDEIGMVNEAKAASGNRRSISLESTFVCLQKQSNKRGKLLGYFLPGGKLGNNLKSTNTVYS